MFYISIWVVIARGFTLLFCILIYVYTDFTIRTYFMSTLSIYIFYIYSSVYWAYICICVYICMCIVVYSQKISQREHTQKELWAFFIPIFGQWDCVIEKFLLRILQLAFYHNLHFLHNHVLLCFKILPQIFYVHMIIPFLYASVLFAFSS